jgi:hypothetical protein
MFGTSKLTASVLATTMLTTQAWAGCMEQPEKTALKVETLQQELMVAALTCNDANPYNAFVLANRPELIHSDQELQDFYSKLYQSEGVAQFQAVKTRLANHFSLDSLHNQQGFCQNAQALFSGLRGPLSSQVSWISVNDTKESCERGAPIVETVEGGGAGFPQTRVAEGRDEPPPAAQDERVADSGYDGPPPPQQQHVAQNYHGASYPDPRGYYSAPPPPNPYWQQAPAYYPQGYYGNGR